MPRRRARRPRRHAEELRNLVELQLNWTVAGADVVAACNGCGACRTQSPEVRMCPIFRSAPAEEASPRAKANLIRGVLTGSLDPKLLTSDEFKAVADLCVNCQCAGWSARPASTFRG